METAEVGILQLV